MTKKPEVPERHLRAARGIFMMKDEDGKRVPLPSPEELHALEDFLKSITLPPPEEEDG